MTNQTTCTDKTDILREKTVILLKTGNSACRIGIGYNNNLPAGKQENGKDHLRYSEGSVPKRSRNSLEK